MEYPCLRISVSFINRDLLSSRLATLLNTILFQKIILLIFFIFFNRTSSIFRTQRNCVFATNSLIFATQCRRPWILLGLHHQSGCKDKGIRKFEFWQRLNSFKHSKLNFCYKRKYKKKQELPKDFRFAHFFSV